MAMNSIRSVAFGLLLLGGAACGESSSSSLENGSSSDVAESADGAATAGGSQLGGSAGAGDTTKDAGSTDTTSSTTAASTAEPVETTDPPVSTEATEPSEAAEQSAAEVDAFSVRAGDCFDMPDGDLIETVSVVACSEPHDSQAFELFDISGFDEIPTPDEMQEVVIEGCLSSAFENFIGAPYEESILALSWFEPSPDTWAQLDDREVVCIAMNEQERLSQDFRGSGL